MLPPMLLEVCIDSPEGLAAAAAGGADRLEVCSALALGGLTPSAPLMAAARATGLPFVAMIRPRLGDFVWTPAELGYMAAEIDHALAMGAQGVVIGASLPDGRLDLPALRQLVSCIPPGTDAVLHRAVDLTPDAGTAVAQAIDLGFARILSSGGAPRATDGLPRLRQMARAAGAAITLMPGSGIDAATLPFLAADLPLTQIHASCARALPQNPAAVALGFTSDQRRETDATLVRALKAACANIRRPS
jgi:copper homeostasis protein